MFMTYEWKCKDCNEQFESKTQHNTETEKVECPNCHSHNTIRIYSCNFVLKGHGWASKTEARK